MNRYRPHRTPWTNAAMAVILVAGLIASVACTSAQIQTPADDLAKLRSTISDQVTDAERADDMLAAVDRMEAVMDGLGELVERHQKAIAELYGNYDATRTEVLEALERYQDERREVVDRLVEAHYEFKALASDDEWPKLAKAERKALKAMATTTLASTPLPLQEG